MPTIEIVRPPSIGAFAARAGDFLERHEAEHCLTLGLCSTLAAEPPAAGAAPFLLIAERAGEVVATVLMTPPWNAVLSRVEDDAAIPAVADALRGVEVPGITGPAGAAERLGVLLAGRTARHATVAMEERIFELRAVTPPEPAPGRLRIGTAADRTLIADWLRAFTVEAMPESPVRDEDEVAGQYVTSPLRTMYLWEDGSPVAMTGAANRTRRGIRIGPVYTPPGLRGRGYASNLVAAVSQRLLDEGRERVFLFTDVANRTSNKIYQAIGYRAVADVRVVRLTPAGS